MIKKRIINTKLETFSNTKRNNTVIADIYMANLTHMQQNTSTALST